MGDSFTHLHVHTEYSMLDGASRVDDAINAAVSDGQPALAITDHGNMYGVLEFYQGCRDAGIKPIIGSEIYLAHESRAERPNRTGRTDDSGGSTGSGQKLYYHAILLAENDIGYKNLIQISSQAFLTGYHYKPRADFELLEKYHEGLIATCGCLGGHVLQSLLQGQEKLALEQASRFQDIFGRDNYFIEIQDHGMPEQKRTNPQLLEIARKINAPIVATNDSHYTHSYDAEAHDALLCVQTGSLLSDTDRFKFHGDQHYLKTAAEMRRLFAEIPSACDNTLWVAERADVNIEFGQPKLPKFPIPEGFASDTDYLRDLTYAGAKRRWGSQLRPDIIERLDFELGVIDRMGFSAYFLITWDLIRFAREKDIRVGPGRGSAAGCAVAYALQITDLDPIKYDLLFERFLNPSRLSMPDIDMDFETRHRDAVIRYAAEKYGRDNVAQIVTFSQIKARAAVRDAARVLGYPYGLGDKVAKAMPPLVMGRDTPLKYCFEEHPKYTEGYRAAAELRDMVDDDPDIARVVEVAKGLEGLRRQDSVHAAAVVITDEPLTEYLPIQRKPEARKSLEETPIVTQYEMHGVESLGLLKMDFLGLRNLDVIADCLTLITQTRAETIDIDSVDLEDKATFELLQRGDTIGVFQLESTPMRALIRSLAPTSFDDIAALVALYRPGPMAANMHNDYADRKNGRQPVEFIHPHAEELLSETYGLMIYQENVMRMAQKFAGYTLAEADSLRKAMGKKIREAMAQEQEKFVNGVVNNGYDSSLAHEMFDIIARFADYAFNKSHSYGYGYVAYQIAYLKANYPVEYLSALLTSVKTRLESAAVYLNECRLMGIEVGVPDINRSESDFTPEPDLNPKPSSPGRIVFGLSAIRNVGEGFVAKVLEERDANGPFESFVDFVERISLESLNKRTIESLIKGGAFDSLGHPRKGLLQVHEQITEMTVERRREHDMGVMSLFGDLDEGPTFDERPEIPDAEFDKKSKLAYEREMLGLYVSDHPLFGYEDQIRRKATATVSELLDEPDRSLVTVGGSITNLQRKWTNRGELMALFDLEDLEGSVEVVVFPSAMKEFGQTLNDDAIVLVRGRKESGRSSRGRGGGSDDAAKLLAMEIDIVEEPSKNPPVRLRLDVAHHEKSKIDELKSVLEAHPGECPVELHLSDRRVFRLPDDYAVDRGNGVVAELRELLGSNSILV
ncbi:MAG: DNA polymerase III subunit alpha [Acidimicrobiaceae bacterium]|nr:DNA polymerase III subunit alpha [Acidimicrobiaceae bacterium]MYA73189.1 DNA polymerase III subunit alpha [Acidimicrobiaceae bacterium]MYD05885.1 DNA polymerase III subunit alpha [Acidimicrobiaceae bacterium]MYG54989.1 DNA polymerase III subunit alpha [Acidimicrobiaceae bacterium]MYI58550.1 DNA polymerase III subunit alpha [Acidimicrobiaceae bacterium]